MTAQTLAPTCSLVRRGVCRAPRAVAFSLIELLTVVFIISLLIAILVPSLNSARNAAKKSTTNTNIRAIGTALELFKNDNERDFAHTNGYPPSFAHPKIPGYSFEAFRGGFPFLDPESESNPPVISGAHWLPAMLTGVDQLGYVSKRSVPPILRKEPWKWYTAQAYENEPLTRMQFYLEPDGIKTIRTMDLRGRQPSNMGLLWPDWDDMKELPVFVDSFDQPILYYAANEFGRTSNLCEELRDEDNTYTGDVQQKGPPYYFHQDNSGFTGSRTSAADGDEGWNFGGGGDHAISVIGDDLAADDLMLPDNRSTFARYILDRAIVRKLQGKIEEGESIESATPLKPVNADTFLLISAGIDGLYGTADDLANFPLSAE